VRVFHPLEASLVHSLLRGPLDNSDIHDWVYSANQRRRGSHFGPRDLRLGG